MPVRVTNNMMVSSYVRDLNRNMKRMSDYQHKMATGKQINRLSDDPVGVVKSLQSKLKMADMQQYKRNVEDASSWMTQSETALDEVNSIIKRTYELGIQLANDTNSTLDRAAASAEIKEMMGQLVQTLNSSMTDKYVFGSYNVTSTPFTVDNGKLYYNGLDLTDTSAANAAALQAECDDVITYDVGFGGLTMPVSMPGPNIVGVGEDSLYNVMNKLLGVLDGSTTGGHDEIRELSGKLLDSQKVVLSQMAEIGGRQNRLEMMNSRFDQDILNYTEMNSLAEDLDLAEATMRFSMAEAVYQAALAVGAKVIQPTLVDFLQ